MADILPTEIWLNIFSHVSYFDLKRAALVSRQFHSILITTVFASELVDIAIKRRPLQTRSGKDSALRSRSHGRAFMYGLHPFLAEMRTYTAPHLPANLSEVTIQPLDPLSHSRRWPLLQTCIAKEPAVVPHVKQIPIFIWHLGMTFGVSNDSNGEFVTVGDVMQLLIISRELESERPSPNRSQCFRHVCGSYGYYCQGLGCRFQGFRVRPIGKDFKDIALEVV